MDSYCVQEDWPTKTARVHRADCRYCNNGHVGERPLFVDCPDLRGYG